MHQNFPDALPAATTLLQYRIEEVLGQGGFGLTYLARDERLEMPVAIKEFFAQDISVRDCNLQIRPKSSLHSEQFNWGMTRFLDEARNLARFRHPNIVQVLNFFEENGTAYMVMAYEHGDSMAAVLKRCPQLSESQLLEIVLPLLSGMETLHDAGYIHRDIKPGNIYLRENGSPVLLDFGSARQAIGEQTKTLTAILTPGYAPFEQYFSSSKRQGPWTDIYSMGGVLYRAVTGKTPTHATDRSSALLRDERDPLQHAIDFSGGSYSDAFLQAIDSALAVLEANRPQTTKEWHNMLVGVIPAHISAIAQDQTQLNEIDATDIDATEVDEVDMVQPFVPPKDSASVVIEMAEPENSGVSVMSHNLNADLVAGQTKTSNATFVYGGLLIVVIVAVGFVGALKLWQADNVHTKQQPGDLSLLYQEAKKGANPALHELKQASLREDALATFYLGDLYDSGRGVQQLERKAITYYKKAAYLGHASARHILGRMYEIGIGVKSDQQEAIKWYRLAAHQDLVDAQLALADLLAHTEANPSQATIWYKKAAEAGHAEAQFRMGQIYENTSDTETDWQTARYWYTKAADQHHYDARQILIAKSTK